MLNSVRAFTVLKNQNLFSAKRKEIFPTAKQKVPKVPYILSRNENCTLNTSFRQYFRIPDLISEVKVKVAKEQFSLSFMATV
jgi:hypothetical protein